MMRLLGWLAGGLLLLPLHAGRATPRLQAEVSHLPMLGHMAELHVGAGSRERVGCPPELVFTLTRMGDPLLPRPEAHALAASGPAGGLLGMTLAPLRGCWGGHQVSMFNLEMAYETSGEGSGTALQVGVLQLELSF